MTLPMISSLSGRSAEPNERSEGSVFPDHLVIAYRLRSDPLIACCAA
jgi:hypothetical protein